MVLEREDALSTLRAFFQIIDQPICRRLQPAYRPVYITHDLHRLIGASAQALNFQSPITVSQFLDSR